MKIAVAGATGRVGRHVVDVLHEFVGQLMDWGRQGDVVCLPKMRTQLVAARTAAEALAGMATDAEPAQAADAPSRRSPGRARRASSRSRRWSPPGAAILCGSRASAMRPTPIAS
jgi:nucleoside-diphosphate-sugar epimerase